MKDASSFGVSSPCLVRDRLVTTLVSASGSVEAIQNVNGGGEF